jgi:tetratricopeptide (TPR) repeat protein
MEFDKSIGVLLGGLGLCGAACLLAPAASAVGAGTLAVLAGGALGTAGQAIAPNIAADLFSRLADWTKGKLRDKGAAAKNHDLRELVIMSITNVLDDVIKNKPGGAAGVKLLNQYKTKVRDRQAVAAIDERFKDTWEQTIPHYFKARLEEFSSVTALTPDIWKDFLNEAPLNSLSADEHTALEAAAMALYNNLPKHLVAAYRDALQHHPTVFVAVQTAILQEIWNGVSRVDQKIDALSDSKQATLTEIRKVGEAIAAENQTAMQDLAAEFTTTVGEFRLLHWKIEFLSRDTLRLVTETHADVKELLKRQEEDRRTFLKILAEVNAGEAAGVSPKQSVQDRRAIKVAVTSRDPELRRSAYLASGNRYMARATHELVKELRLLRPAFDGFQQKNDEFADTMFEGDLLWAEGKREEAIQFYETAHALKPSNGFAAVALANALMDLALTSAPDGSDWNPGRDKWGDSVERVGRILLPFLEAGNEPSNQAYLSAEWAHAHLWYHCARTGSADAVEISTSSLVRADEASPNHPVTLRLLGRNFSEFAREKECAEPYFKRAIDADPDDIRQKFYYGLYLIDLPSRAADAAAVFEQCLDIDPDDPHVLELFAFLLSKQPANAARAELMWKHALRIAPSHPVGWQHYGKFLSSLLEGAARAEEVYKQGLSKRPNDAELWAAYAILLERQPGREGEAMAAYDKVLTLHPGWIDAMIRSVMHKIVAGALVNPEQAGLWLVNEGVTNKEPKLSVAGGWLGLLYAKPDDQVQALTRIKSLREHFGESMGFIRQPRNIAQAVAAGNQFAEWLTPLSKVIAGELPLSSLDDWEAWSFSS